jgi:hypothetical protein
MEIPQIGDGCAACVNLGASDADGAGDPKFFKVRHAPVFSTLPRSTTVSASPRAWYGTQDLRSTFLTAVGHVVNLAERNPDRLSQVALEKLREHFYSD